MAKLFIFLLMNGFILNITSGAYYEWQLRCLMSSADVNEMAVVDFYLFNKVEFLRFNQTLKRFKGLTPYGINKAMIWNNDPDIIDYHLTFLDLCKYYGQILDFGIGGKLVEPQVKVKLMRQSGGANPAILMCSAYNFYPRNIVVTWLRNGKEITDGLISTKLLADGDWHYQIHSNLKYLPQPGEEILCMVEHASFRKPMFYKYVPSDSVLERIEIAIGTSGLVLGVWLAAAGFIYYKKQSSSSNQREVQSVNSEAESL